MNGNKYSISREFNEGFLAGVSGTGNFHDQKSEHWLAGANAGAGYRGARQQCLINYLTEIGCEPMSIITIKDVT